MFRQLRRWSLAPNWHRGQPATLCETIIFYRGFGWAVAERPADRITRSFVLAMDEGLVSCCVQNASAIGRQRVKVLERRHQDSSVCYKGWQGDLKADVTADPFPDAASAGLCQGIRSSKMIEMNSRRGRWIPRPGDKLGRKLRAVQNHLQLRDRTDVDGTSNAQDPRPALAGLAPRRIRPKHLPHFDQRALPVRKAFETFPPLMRSCSCTRAKARSTSVQSGWFASCARPDTRRWAMFILCRSAFPAVGGRLKQGARDNERLPRRSGDYERLAPTTNVSTAPSNRPPFGQDISDRVEIVASMPIPKKLRRSPAVVDKMPTKTNAASSGHRIRQAWTSGWCHRGGRTQPDRDDLLWSMNSRARSWQDRSRKCRAPADILEDWSAPSRDARTTSPALTALAERFRHRKPAKLSMPSLQKLARRSERHHLEATPSRMLGPAHHHPAVFEDLVRGSQVSPPKPVSRASKRVAGLCWTRPNSTRITRPRKFLRSSQERSQGITDPQAKQKLIVELYGQVLRRRFPRTTEKAGIVYTPSRSSISIIHWWTSCCSRICARPSLPRRQIIDPSPAPAPSSRGLLAIRPIRARRDGAQKFRNEIPREWDCAAWPIYIWPRSTSRQLSRAGRGGHYVAIFEGHLPGPTPPDLWKATIWSRIKHAWQLGAAREAAEGDGYSGCRWATRRTAAGQTSANDNQCQTVTYPPWMGGREVYAAAHQTPTCASALRQYIRAIRWHRQDSAVAGVMAYVTNEVVGGWKTPLTECVLVLPTSSVTFSFPFARKSANKRRKLFPAAKVERFFVQVVGAPIAITILVRIQDSAHRGQI